MAEAERIIADPRLYSSTKSFDIIAQQVIAPNIEPLYRIIESNRNQRTVIVASGICLGARMAQEKLSIPLATIHLQPALIRSRVDGGLQGRIPMGRNLPRWWKNSVYRLVDRFYVDRQLGGPVNRFRASLGLPPVQRVFERWIYSPQLVIGLFPSWFAPVQPDWPPDTHLTGIVLHDAGSHYGLPPEVEQFLSSGDPPVLFTPGCAGANLQTFFSESVEACRRTGLRAMLVASFPQQLPPNLPSGVRAFSYLPFSRVLSLCAALVHPGGGIGTIAQSIFAGVPQLIVPHGNDQARQRIAHSPSWARSQHRSQPLYGPAGRFPPAPPDERRSNPGTLSPVFSSNRLRDLRRQSRPVDREPRFCFTMIS